MSRSSRCGFSLTRLGTHSLGKDLRIVALGDLPDFILRSLRVYNPVLPLYPILDLLPELLFDDLVLVQETGESGLDLLDLSLHGSVAFGHFEQLLDLTLALLSCSFGFIVQLVDSGCGLGVGRRLCRVRPLSTQDCTTIFD